MALSEQERDELKEAVRAGIVEALKSEEARDAVLGAISTWFDKQSGKAAKKLLAAVLLVLVLKLAAFPDVWKTWITSLGK